MGGPYSVHRGPLRKRFGKGGLVLDLFGSVPEGPFLEGTEKFSGPESHKKINLKFTELFFSHNFNTNKVNFTSMQSLMPIHCFLFEIRIIV